MPGSTYLADSNILLRLANEHHAQYQFVRRILHALREKGMMPAYTLQNMAEFWNVSTRPRERNGFGLTVEEAEMNARVIEQNFVFLPDNETVYREWRRLVVQHSIAGVQVHDARLAAAMYAHGLTEILTLNPADFKRFDGIRPIDIASV